MTTHGAVVAHGLTKAYGDVHALNGLSLTVPEGTVLALLGPNGAGKTTSIRILTTLLTPDSGRASVAGADLITEPAEVRRRIGLSGQYAALDEYLTGYENLELIGRLYHLGAKRARARAIELLERFSLADAGGRPVATYSGGMRRRLDLAGALVARPRVLVLDEPTTGLDPHSRNELWDVIRDLVGQGSTLVLTTQYMEEAEQLADDIVVIDHGRRIAQGTSEELKAEIGGERMEVAVSRDASTSYAQDILTSFATGDIRINEGTLTVPITGGARTLTQALRALDANGVDVIDVGLRKPTLDDVFLTLTGHAADTTTWTSSTHPAQRVLQES
jgi:ABC-2 type transport system ATP-binding protein